MNDNRNNFTWICLNYFYVGQQQQWFGIGLWFRRSWFDSRMVLFVQSRCCCFLEQELYPHCSSRPICIIGDNWGTWGISIVLWVVLQFRKRLPSHCSSPPRCNGYLVVLALAREGPSHENVLYADAAIQGKINNTQYLMVCGIWPLPGSLAPQTSRLVALIN